MNNFYSKAAIIKVIFLQFGNTPEFYKSNQTELSHRALLQDFGATEEAVDEMLSDKGKSS